MCRDVSSCFMMCCDVLSWFVIFHCHGFIMVRDVSLSWFRHGSSWFTVMVRHGLSWFTVMVRYGSSWFTVMVRHGLSWFTVMVRHGSSWFVMVHCHGSSWFVMVCHGSSWFTVMVHHGSSWFTVMVRHGSLSWFRHGSSWFVMCYSLKFSRRRSCDPLFSQSGSQIHYQISFLMRLLIFPFPFKEHTSKELC